MLKILRSTESLIWLGKGGVGIGDDSRAGHDKIELDRSEVDNSEFDDGKFGDDEVEKKVQNLSKLKKTVGWDFFIFRAKLKFIKLKQAFVKSSILHHFNPERHIRIETDVLGYAICRVLSQLTLEDSGQWYPVVFFFL